MGEPNEYRKAVVTCCLSIAGSQGSPVCAILGSRDHLVVKLWKVKNYMDRQAQYESYCNDRSVKEIMEDELDSIIDRLMTPGSEAADGRDPGRAESLCWAITLIENPYAPNMDHAKNKAMLRYERKLRESAAVETELESDESDTVEV